MVEGSDLDAGPPYRVTPEVMRVSAVAVSQSITSTATISTPVCVADDLVDNAARLLGATLPTRRQLRPLAVRAQGGDLQPLRLAVHRSLPFEWVASTLDPFLKLTGRCHEADYSDYDPSLPQWAPNTDADVHVLWLDWRLYRERNTPSEAVAWLADRLKGLRTKISRPVLINNWPTAEDPIEILSSSNVGVRNWARKLNLALDDMVLEFEHCHIVDLDYLSHTFASQFLDDRNDREFHFPFSNDAAISIARHLGVHLLPALLGPRLKAIALDLDDTLYAGVLGEDGLGAVQLTPGHRALQAGLRQLKDSGLLLTLCSRNEESDVRELFRARDDFPLRWEDFAATAVNWAPKAENLLGLAQTLNIGIDSFLFLDDNPAELLKAQTCLPTVKSLIASEDGYETLHRVCHFPNLFRLRSTETDALRTRDVQARTIRQKLLEASDDPHAYLENLHMVVSLDWNEVAHQQRVHELSQKTNQFNLSLKRLSLHDVRLRMGSPYVTLTVSLSDKLSDSGLIGVFVSHVVGGQAHVEEMLFSCRALGREVETLAYHHLLKMLREQGVTTLDFDVQHGPRNGPALTWLARMTGESVPETRTRAYAVDTLIAQTRPICATLPVRIETPRG